MRTGGLLLDLRTEAAAFYLFFAWSRTSPAIRPAGSDCRSNSW